MSFHKKLQAIDKLKYLESILLANEEIIDKTSNQISGTIEYVCSLKSSTRICIRKRGRKSLRDLGFNEQQIDSRRKEQNRIAARNSRKRKKSRETPEEATEVVESEETIELVESEGTNRVITQPQWHMLRSTLEHVIECSDDNTNKKHLQHSLILINNLAKITI